jgi:hypothetical protein
MGRHSDRIRPFPSTARSALPILPEARGQESGVRSQGSGVRSQGSGVGSHLLLADF